MDSRKPNQSSATRLPQGLSALETWGFGLTGHVGWIGTAPVIHAALGSQAIFVWLPGVIVSVLLNLQVQRLGRHWPEMAGGTPNYAARLLRNFPGLGQYAALGYFLGWVAAPAVYAIVLTDLIKANLEPLGIACPETSLKIGFTAIAFIVGFSGTRALGLLHLLFVVPAIALLLAFCLQGVGWLAFSTNSPGFFPIRWSSLSFREWAKWFFIATYSVYSGETASSFVADSRHPSKTLQFLSLSAGLMPLVFLGGSWVLMQLATQPGLGDNLYLNLLAAARLFWGDSASFLVTLLISFCCLLSCATAVANTSRILYQLALDGYLSPVFTVVSRRGVLEPALIFSFILSLLCLVWGDISNVVMVTGTGYLVSIMGLHLGLWLSRGRPEVLWSWWSLGFFVIEAVVLVVGGLAWSWRDLLSGLLLPIVILAIDAVLRRAKFALLHPKWWTQHYHAKFTSYSQDFMGLQVIVLILLICSAATIGWMLSAQLDKASSTTSSSALLAVLLVTLSFLGVAIACWTTLPQIASIDQAGQEAKNLFITALETVPDTILILDEKGIILQANLAAEELFHRNIQNLVGCHLSEFFSFLVGSPEQWSNQSEPINQGCYKSRIVEFTLSQPSNQAVKPFIMILRDITKRKQAEVDIRSALIKEKELSELKSRFIRMASHEFRTPLTTILFSTGMLREYGDNFSTEEKLQYLQRIQVTIEQMNQLLNDVLLIDKAEAGKLEFNPAKFDLIQFCRTLIDEIQISSNNHKINFIHHNSYISVCLDEKLLWHILNNLLSNSIKYSPQGGNVNLNLVCEQNQVFFQIQDWGMGIPAADQTKLFDSFYRGNNVGVLPGTGLGLAIVKKAVDLHNGKIGIISQVGTGTTFTVSLPLNMPGS